MKRKHLYRVWAINSQGANIELGEFYTLQRSIQHARNRLGAGWTVNIDKVILEKNGYCPVIPFKSFKIKRG